MTRAVVWIALVAVALAALPDSGEALGLNTGMPYRYPWGASVSMTRTQGWGDADPSHAGDLYYAVDWDNASDDWLARAANAGTMRCNRVGDGINEGLGNYLSIYNSVSNQTAVYAHLVDCQALYGNGTPWPVTQGQGLAVTGCTGVCEAQHLHFHVSNGDTWDDAQITVPFAMSDKDNFDTQYASDGPSDNVPVAVDAGDVTDTVIRSTYLAQSGLNPASESWWNVGAAYRSTTEHADEWGGPCRNTATAYVHLCPSNHGAGLMANQNYIDWAGVRHSIYRTNVSGHVYGQIQGALSHLVSVGGTTQILAKVMGAPTIPEGSGIQAFQGGTLIRANGAGIRIEAWQGSTLIGVLRYDAYGAFCPSINNDRAVSSGDLGLLASWFGTSNINGDLNGNGTIDSGDLGLVASRMNPPIGICAVADP